jgi:hypothetical protein
MVFFLIPAVFVFLASSCKKETVIPDNFLEQLFENNIINKDFVVTLATDSGRDITSEYRDYKFVLSKNDLYHGPLKATKGSQVYEGSWSSNSDYSKLIIVLPDTPEELVFLTREWRFTSKNIPKLELAPWGSTAPVVLHMLRQ